MMTFLSRPRPTGSRYRVYPPRQAGGIRRYVIIIATSEASARLKASHKMAELEWGDYTPCELEVKGV